MLFIFLPNLSIGEPTNTPPSVPCLFCRFLLPGSCPDYPETLRVRESTIGAVCGNRTHDHIVGPHTTALAHKKLLLVAIDYFSKWIEVEAFASIKDKDVTQFIWKNIIWRFGIPRSIVSDNGPQFVSRAYRNFYQELKIKNLYSTPRYPQSNGQAEASNKTLLTALKKRLDSAKGKWVDELHG